jgi:hypothetical protein
MPRKPTDYSRCVMYQIKCNDPEIDHVYVGHTTDFTKRKSQHKNDSKSSQRKLYQTIRANGGWENFKMLQLESFPCNNKREAEAREDALMTELKANMNQKRAQRSSAQWNIDHREHVRQRKKKYRQANIERLNEQQKQYQEANKEHQKQYREANKEKIAEKQKQYREANKEKITEKHKQRYEANKEQLNERRRARYHANKEQLNERRRARNHATKQSIEPEEVDIDEEIISLNCNEIN